MTAPPITQYAGTIPNKGQSQTDFDTNVDDWLNWTTLTHAPEMEAFGDWADTLRATLIAGNLPSLTGNALNTIRVNAAEDNVEFVPVTTVGWALLAAVDKAAQRTALDLKGGALLDVSSDTDLSVDGAKLPTRDAVAGAMAATPQVGVGQSWSTPSRAVNTVYQNTTGGPIQVVVRSNNGSFDVSEDNITWVSLVGTGSGAQYDRPISPIIPNGHYYRLVNNGGTATIVSWAELS